MNKRQSPDTDETAPPLSAWQDSLGRVVVGEANTDGAWIAASPDTAIDMEEVA